LAAIYKYLTGKDSTYKLEIDTYRIPEDEEYFREFLNIFHRKRSFSSTHQPPIEFEQKTLNVVVDINSNYRIRAFLKALKDSILIRKQYNYVISNFVSAVLAHDAIIVAAEAIRRVLKTYGANLFKDVFSHHQLYNDGYPGLYCRPIEDRQNSNRQFEPFEFGDKIFDALKEVVLDEEDGTFTGRIQFDGETLLRTNFTATAIEIKPGRMSLNSIKERFEWRQGKGFETSTADAQVFNGSQLTTKPTTGRRTLRVVTILVKFLSGFSNFEIFLKQRIVFIANK
uniref:ANF_receptor domain-containing protein n=1 Tax=Anisakis simplex TaxID=6269 RepID=A0A0M3KCZ3_ANISI